MTTYTLTGLTFTNPFRVLYGTALNTLLYDATYPGGTTSVSIDNLGFNTKYYIVFQDNVTNFTTTRIIRTESDYCATGCDAVFSVVQIQAPTPPPSNTPTITPTVSFTPTLTPSITPSTSEIIAFSPTPTPSVSHSPTPTVTPTVSTTPLNNSLNTCSSYLITYNCYTSATSTAVVTYLDCNNIQQTQSISNFTSQDMCIMEFNGRPIIYHIDSDPQGEINIARSGPCFNAPLT